MLHFSPAIEKVVYVYTYRNQFLLMNKAVDLLGRYHTIDTFSQVRIRSTRVESRDYSTLTTPPLRVNGLSAASGRHLFIVSPLLSDNGDAEAFKANHVIDVYALDSVRYAGSFYLPRHYGEGLRDFRVYGHELMALFDRWLVIYQLPPLTNGPGRATSTHGRNATPHKRAFARAMSGMHAEHLIKPK